MSDPPTPPAASVKNELQELLQKSIHNLPPPVYEQVQSQRKGEFTAKVTIVDRRDRTLLQEFGYGRTKKDSETNAAKIVIPKVKDMLKGGHLPVSLMYAVTGIISLHVSVGV